jgi:hypothetical protein
MIRGNLLLLLVQYLTYANPLRFFLVHPAGDLPERGRTGDAVAPDGGAPGHGARDAPVHDPQVPQNDVVNGVRERFVRERF